jgi:hypothetical protein
VLSPLVVPFLLTIVLCVAGIAALAFLFVTLSPWVQRHLAALVKGLGSRNQL